MAKELKIIGFVLQSGVNIVATADGGDDGMLCDPAVIINQGKESTLVPLIPQSEDGKFYPDGSVLGAFTPNKQLADAYQQFVRNCTSARTGIVLPPNAH